MVCACSGIHKKRIPDRQGYASARARSCTYPRWGWYALRLEFWIPAHGLARLRSPHRSKASTMLLGVTAYPSLAPLKPTELGRTPLHKNPALTSWHTARLTLIALDVSMSKVFSAGNPSRGQNAVSSISSCRFRIAADT